LITATGANVAKTALVDVELPEAYVSQHVGLVRLVNRDCCQFIYYWIISSSHGRAQLLDAAYGAGKPGLNLDNIRELIIALPSLPEQQEIVQRIKTLFKIADQIEQRYQKARGYVDKLTQSILAKAFRGELVPQDPTMSLHPSY
jgi:type I restriction enzyme S subunit